MELLAVTSLVVVILVCLSWLCGYKWMVLFCARPLVFYKEDSEFCSRVELMCPTLLQYYCPPLLWGRSGHLQTLAFGTISRFNFCRLSGQRHSVVVEDGSTLHYDEYFPNDRTEYPYTMIVCPGIGSCSERGYIQSFVNHAVSNGFRVIVFNHLGSLNGEQLTGNRIFTYGGTGDLAVVFDHSSRLHPDSRYIGVGFSLGACILLRFLGENKDRRKKFICATSVCQGYDPRIALKHMHDWNNFRRIYNFIISKKQLKLIKRHHSQLLNISTTQSNKSTIQLNKKQSTTTDELPNGSDKNCQSNGCNSQYDANGFALDHNKRGLPDTKKVIRATSIYDLDEYYTRRVCGFDSVYDLYRWTSCVDLMNSITDLPVLLVNTRDDPLVDIDGEMISFPKKYINMNPQAMFVVPHHGGHLGFFEGGILIPHTTAWIDRLLVQYTQACISLDL